MRPRTIFGTLAIPALAAAAVACSTPTDLCACTFAAADIGMRVQLLDAGRRPIGGAPVAFEGERTIAGRRRYETLAAGLLSDSTGRVAATIRVLYGTTPLRAAIVPPGRRDTVRVPLGRLEVTPQAVPTALQYTVLVP